MQKIPYLLIVGDKEIDTNAVSVRERGKGDLGQMPTEKFIENIKDGIIRRN
jgi:threonyl-tRNA synthetase